MRKTGNRAPAGQAGPPVAAVLLRHFVPVPVYRLGPRAWASTTALPLVAARLYIVGPFLSLRALAAGVRPGVRVYVDGRCCGATGTDHLRGRGVCCEAPLSCAVRGGSEPPSPSLPEHTGDTGDTGDTHKVALRL